MIHRTLLAALLLMAGCAQLTSKPCTDQLSACGQKIAQCAASANCDVSECVSKGVLPTPVATP